MKLEEGKYYIDPHNGDQVLIIGRNLNGTFNSDTGTTFLESGEWAGGGWFLQEMELPTVENKPFTPTPQYVSMLEAIVGNEAVTKIKELLK